jgi:hypothetical protein
MTEAEMLRLLRIGVQCARRLENERKRRDRGEDHEVEAARAGLRAWGINAQRRLDETGG